MANPSWQLMVNQLRITWNLTRLKGRQVWYGTEGMYPPSGSSHGIPFVLTRPVVEKLQTLGWSPVHLQGLPVIVCHQLVENQIRFDTSLFVDLRAGRYDTLMGS